jgi:polysaccharide biosynthesis protein PslH
MRVLYLTGWYPYPPDNGSKLRIYSLLTELARRHSITLIVLTASPVAETPPPLARLCKVLQVPARSCGPAGLRSLLGLLSPRPRMLVNTYQPLMSRQIRRELQSGDYQLLVATEWITAAYCETIPDVPALFENAEIGMFESRIRQAASPLRRLRLRLSLLKLGLYLRGLLPRFRACTVASQSEKELLRSLVPRYAPIEIVPNCVRAGDYEGVSRPRRPNTLVFTGSFAYEANYDAMAWFLRDVYPLILAQIPDAHLTITGEHRDLPLPGRGQVTRTGAVCDVRPWIAQAAASVVPIRLGGGTRLKILEAMFLKTAVVSTSKGCEGLDVRHGEHLLVGDTPGQFAAHTARLLRDPDLREELTGNAHRLVLEKYDSAVVGPRFCDLVEDLVSAP